MDGYVISQHFLSIASHTAHGIESESGRCRDMGFLYLSYHYFTLKNLNRGD